VFHRLFSFVYFLMCNNGETYFRIFGYVYLLYMPSSPSTRIVDTVDGYITSVCS